MGGVRVGTALRTAAVSDSAANDEGNVAVGSANACKAAGGYDDGVLVLYA